MSDAAKHSELGRLIQLERFSHPREEVSETVVPALDSFRYSSATARER